VRLDVWRSPKIAPLVITLQVPDAMPAWERPYPRSYPRLFLYDATGKAVIWTSGRAAGWPYGTQPFSQTLLLEPGDYKLAVGGTDLARYFYPDAATLDAAQIIRVPESGTAITLPRPPPRCPFVAYEHALRLPIITRRDQ
jgi:hypothetical protein